MSKITLRGGAEYTVKAELARKLKLMRWGDPMNLKKTPPQDKHKPIEINGDCFELGEIKLVLINDDMAKIYSKMNKNAEEKDKAQEDRKKYLEQVKKWDSVAKSHRMLKTYCFLAFCAKGGSGKIEDVMFKDPLYSDLMTVLDEFFEKNPEEIHAPKEVYWDKIPLMRKKQGSVGTFKHIGGII